jgi:hypothetical protein
MLPHERRLRHIVSATTPFHRDDLERLRIDAPAVVRARAPDYEAVYRDLQWKMFAKHREEVCERTPSLRAGLVPTIWLPLHHQLP